MRIVRPHKTVARVGGMECSTSAAHSISHKNDIQTEPDPGGYAADYRPD